MTRLDSHAHGGRLEKVQPLLIPREQLHGWIPCGQPIFNFKPHMYPIFNSTPGRHRGESKKVNGGELVNTTQKK